MTKSPVIFSGGANWSYLNPAQHIMSIWLWLMFMIWPREGNHWWTTFPDVVAAEVGGEQGALLHVNLRREEGT